MIFDYPRRRLMLEPNAHQAEPFDSPMSGFGLETDGRDFKTLKVRGIIANSPAAESGLRDADIITEIDGKPAVTFKLYQLRQMFKQEGREVRLGVLRREGQQQLKLKLRRLI